ncbi:MAG: ribosomal protein S18-alanine N-acetyltransferase [Chloroflexi bacterium]|nr:ribosomal protein S18-alanine N-acetyltransferase [Chloroflexota bacterium]MCL5110540.1 ribosomal protein S18-alanine N-acetyltransferase [Chloroflexota bacterium]
MPYHIRAMRVEDVDEVVQIEHQSFSLAWPASAYRREIRDNRMASYVVIERLGADNRPPEPPRAPTHDGRVRRWLEGLVSKRGELLRADQPHLVGYAGTWLMLDEAHITTIAVRPEYRGRGFGEMLMIGLIEKATEVGARWVTLEVRASNTVAQNLYRKYTFHAEGVRKGYYSDNNEDAVIMWSDDIRTPEFQTKFRALKSEFERRRLEDS